MFLDEFNNTFKIEDPYKLNCKESRKKLKKNERNERRTTR
jgi:hypothetical protein